MDQLRFAIFYGKTRDMEKHIIVMKRLTIIIHILKNNQSSGWLDNSYRNYDIDYPYFEGENLYCDWLGKNGQQLWKDWH